MTAPHVMKLQRVYVPYILEQPCSVLRVVLSWPGVTAAPHRFGGVAFHLGRRELGHLHGDYLADLALPVASATNWCGRTALALFCLAYDRAISTRRW